PDHRPPPGHRPRRRPDRRHRRGPDRRRRPPPGAARAGHALSPAVRAADRGRPERAVTNTWGAASTMRARNAPVNDVDRLLDATKNLLRGTPDPRDEALLEEAHPADIAVALRQLPLADQVTLFRTFSQERAGEVLPELDDHALL